MWQKCKKLDKFLVDLALKTQRKYQNTNLDQLLHQMKQINDFWCVLVGSAVKEDESLHGFGLYFWMKTLFVLKSDIIWTVFDGIFKRQTQKYDEIAIAKKIAKRELMFGFCA
eukprot:20047_1